MSAARGISPSSGGSREITQNGLDRMLRNLWTVLTVFVCVFALAWLSDTAKARQAGASIPTSPAHVERGASESPAIEAPEIYPSAGTASAAPAAQDKAPPPPADSMTSEAPDRLLFDGRGRFQIYRQGDITWRLDTDTGVICVLLATDEQWRRSRVFQNACSTN